MPTSTNQHGLTRAIPDAVKRQVRKDCGFACVVCGKLGRHYDHFDPEFKDCETHLAEGIALLCPTCHQDKTSRIIDNERIKIARERAKVKWSNPAWRSHYCGENISVGLGRNLLTAPSVKLSFGEVEFLRFDACSDPYEPWNLTGALYDGKGTVARFEKNELIACSSNWDVELEGQLLTFRRDARNIVLKLRLKPDKIIIELLNFKWPSGVELNINSDGDIIIKNISHSEFNNKIDLIILTENEIISTPSPAPMQAQYAFRSPSNLRNARTNKIEFSKNKVVVNCGFVDLAQFIDLKMYLSADMLSPDLSSD